VASDEHALVGDAGNIEVDLAAVAAIADGKVWFMHDTDSSRPAAATVPLVLASTSPARLATLRAAGIEPERIASHVDEDAVGRALPAGDPATRTARLVQALARAKARAVLADDGARRTVSGRRMRDIDGLVLGGDSLFELDGAALGKPHTPEVARERIRRMRGCTGALHSGHWLIAWRGGRIVAEVGAVDRAEVTFGDISDAEIDAYVATGEPLEVAGSFTVDGLGQAFITAVSGAPSCVIGLSVPVVRRLAGELGVAWPRLWNR
jgi:septum formation protein